VTDLLDLASFREFGTRTKVRKTKVGKESIPTFVNKFWTDKQRQAHSLHEVSYRACFKPALPRFFIERLTKPDDLVYDPFMGRGTALLEAALLGRRVAGCDVNPLSRMLIEPRLAPPELNSINLRLDHLAETLKKTKIDDPPSDVTLEDLTPFYHPDTLADIAALRKHFIVTQKKQGVLGGVDNWIRMVAMNRLTGHSPGFFSVYTLPPNQAVMPARQRKINADRRQKPERKDVYDLILKKSRSLLSEVTDEERDRLKKQTPILVTAPCDAAHQIPYGEVALIVTSPPFLDVVNYASDNWLRCWFCGIDPKTVPITMAKRVPDWQAVMTDAFMEFYRVLRPGGHVAFEVGEVRGGKVRLEEAVIPCGNAANLKPKLVLINTHNFTKTANCWGVDNNAKGTNTNRVVVFEKKA